MTDLEFFSKFMKNYEIKFKVNKEKGIVTCIITTTEDFMSKIIKYGFAEPFNRMPLELKDIDEDKLDVRTYVGIAKCNPEDEWDEEYGKHLAEYRAILNRRADVNHEIETFINKMNACIDRLYLYGRVYRPHHPDER